MFQNQTKHLANQVQIILKVGQNAERTTTNTRISAICIELNQYFTDFLCETFTLDKT